jgi:TPR repeat protein
VTAPRTRRWNKRRISI